LPSLNDYRRVHRLTTTAPATSRPATADREQFIKLVCGEVQVMRNARGH
jgi:hypothetical protein